MDARPRCGASASISRRGSARFRSTAAGCQSPTPEAFAGRPGSPTRTSRSRITCAAPPCRRREGMPSCSTGPATTGRSRLDRGRPLWDVVLLEGLEGGRWALATKTHHALVDGVGSVDVGHLVLDPSAAAAPQAGRRPGQEEPQAVEEHASLAAPRPCGRRLGPAGRSVPVQGAGRAARARRVGSRTAQQPERADRDAPALPGGAHGLGGAQARSRTPSAARSTTWCWRLRPEGCDGARGAR